MKAKMCLVGYTYRGYETEYVFKKAKEYGFDSVELRDFSDMDLTPIHSLKKSLEKAKELSSKYDVEAPVTFMPIGNAYGDKEMLQVLPLLAENDISILHTHIYSLKSDSRTIVSADASEEDYRNAANMLRTIGDEAEDHNITVAVETHMGTIHDTSSSLIRLLQYADCKVVKASLDFANLLIVNRHENLLATIRRLAGKVGYTHIKNCRFYPWGHDWGVPLQLGEINYFKVLKELVDSGYSGLFATEYCGGGDPDAFASMDAVYLRSLLNRVTEKM